MTVLVLAPDIGGPVWAAAVARGRKMLAEKYYDLTLL
jgi:hypothetical protein